MVSEVEGHRRQKGQLGIRAVYHIGVQQHRYLTHLVQPCKTQSRLHWSHVLFIGIKTKQIISHSLSLPVLLQSDSLTDNRIHSHRPPHTSDHSLHSHVHTTVPNYT